MFRHIKNIISEIFQSRLLILILVFCILASVLIHRLFNLQIVNGEDYLNNYKLMIKKTTQTQGTRGNIYDRNGKILATNKLAYSVQIEDNGSYENITQKNQMINDTINKVIDMVEAQNDDIVSDFGIIINNKNKYAFLYEDGTRKLRFLADVYGYPTIEELSEEEMNSTPQDVIDFLCADKREVDYGFGIDQTIYTKERVLQLVTIRYGMRLNSYQKYIPTTIASDVSDETVAVIMENIYDLQGISIGEESLRVYPDSKYFASIIGYTGKISQDEYDLLDESEKENYSLTDIIGKTGIEKEMDSFLQGDKGEKVVYVDNMGKVIETEIIKDSVAGNDVYLTIDKDIQITAYNLIEEKLAAIIISKMSNILDYNRGAEKKSSDIIIPVGDIYYGLIANEIISVDELAEENATKTEKQVYKQFCARQESAIDKIARNMKDSNASSYKDCSKELQAYLYYLTSEVLTYKTGILDTDKLDTSDPVYQEWKNETINIYEYLNHAISKNWIDTTVLSNYMDVENRYSDSTEIYNSIISVVKDFLSTDSEFEKLVYRYMIKDGSISGTQICLLLFDQGVLEDKNSEYNLLLSGHSPFQFIKNKIKNLEITPGQLGVEPSTGSLVMTDTNNGNTIACVSYPGYDNNKLANIMDVDYYNQLQTDLTSPFYNKATQEKTAPGSTFKMVSSAAGLTENVITQGSVLKCAGPYKNITPSPKCWIYPGGHGSLNVVNAIAHSCNNFYYEVGYRLGLESDGDYSSEQGIKALIKYAEMFGLGETSGLEIDESEPLISTEDAVRSAIGQGTHNYATSQLARYVSGIANKGTVYNLTLLDRVENIDKKVIKTYKPSVYNEIQEISDSTFNAIHQGMRKMVLNDNRFNVLSKNDITLAGKTGTAQQSTSHADHVLFVGFAPIDNPEIALSVRITNGYSSGYAAEIGRDIVLKYFGAVDDKDILKGKAGTLGTATHD